MTNFPLLEAGMGSGYPEGLLYTHIVQEVELVACLPFPYAQVGRKKNSGV